PPHPGRLPLSARVGLELSPTHVGHGTPAGSHAVPALFLLVSSGVSPDRVGFLCFVAPVALVEIFVVPLLFRESRVGDHRSVRAVVLGLLEVLRVLHDLGVVLVVDHRVAFEVYAVLGSLGALDGVGVLFFGIIRPVVRVRFFFRARGTVRVLGAFGRFVPFGKLTFFGAIIADRFPVPGLDGPIHTVLEGVGVLDEFLVLGGRSGALDLGELDLGIFGALDRGELGLGYLRVRAGLDLLLLGPFSVHLAVEAHTAFGVHVVLGESG